MKKDIDFLDYLFKTIEKKAKSKDKNLIQNFF